MKKSITLGMALFIAAGTISSCKKKEDTITPTTRDYVIGKWKSSFDAEDNNNNNMPDQSERVPASGYIEYLTVNSDGTFRDSLTGSASGVLTGTWSLEGNNQYIRMNATGFPSYSGKLYQIDASNMIIQDTSASPASWTGYVHF